MTTPNHDWRTYHLTLNPEPDPVITVGTEVHGFTTDGDPLLLYVTEVAEDGTIRIGADKPTT